MGKMYKMLDGDISDLETYCSCGNVQDEGYFSFNGIGNIINTIINTIRLFKAVLCRLEKGYVGHRWFTKAALIM